MQRPQTPKIDGPLVLEDKLVIETFVALKEFSPNAYRHAVSGLLKDINDDELSLEDILWARDILLGLGEVSIH